MFSREPPRPRTSAARLAALAAAALAASGCFSYVPTALDRAAVGGQYRVLITRQRMEALRDLDEGGLPESGPPLLRGTLVGRDAISLSLRVPLTSRQVGFHQQEIDRQVSVPTADVQDIEARVLSRPRTGIALAAATALAAGVIVAIVHGARDWDRNPDAPSPDAFRAPPGTGGIPISGFSGSRLPRRR